jgi:ATP-dependent DNA helicase Q1
MSFVYTFSLTLSKQYFATSASQVLREGTDSQNAPPQSCGHCDNCVRVPDDLETLDVTTDVWRSLKVVMEVSRSIGRVTLSGLADLVRGLGGGTFALVGKGQSAADRGRMDLEAVCGGKVTLNKEVRLPLALFLAISTVNSYLTASEQKLS